MRIESIRQMMYWTNEHVKWVLIIEHKPTLAVDNTEFEKGNVWNVFLLEEFIFFSWKRISLISRPTTFLRKFFCGLMLKIISMISLEFSRSILEQLSWCQEQTGIDHLVNVSIIDKLVLFLELWSKCCKWVPRTPIVIVPVTKVWYVPRHHHQL